MYRPEPSPPAIGALYPRYRQWILCAADERRFIFDLKHRCEFLARSENAPFSSCALHGINGLEKVGLAGPILSDDCVYAGYELKLRLSEGSKILQNQLFMKLGRGFLHVRMAPSSGIAQGYRLVLVRALTGFVLAGRRDTRGLSVSLSKRADIERLTETSVDSK